VAVAVGDGLVACVFGQAFADDAVAVLEEDVGDFAAFYSGACSGVQLFLDERVEEVGVILSHQLPASIEAGAKRFAVMAAVDPFSEADRATARTPLKILDGRVAAGGL